MAKKFMPTDFRQKDTIRKVVRQWNKLSNTQKKNVSLSELTHIKKMAKENIRPELFLQVAKIYNQKVSASNKVMGRTEKAQLTRLANKQSKVEYQEIKEKKDITTKIKKIQKKTGVNVPAGQLMTHGIPSADIMTINEEQFIQQRIEENKLGPKNKQLKEKTVISRAKKELKEAKQKAKELKLNKLEETSIKRTNDFLDTYFQSSGDPQKGAIIKEYVKNLTLQQRYNLMDTLVSDTFKQVYDSDPDNANYVDDPTERAEKRQTQLISILKNETGLHITANSVGQNVTVTPIKGHKKKKDGKYSFNHYL